MSAPIFAVSFDRVDSTLLSRSFRRRLFEGKERKRVCSSSPPRRFIVHRADFADTRLAQSGKSLEPR